MDKIWDRKSFEEPTKSNAKKNS